MNIALEFFSSWGDASNGRLGYGSTNNNIGVFPSHMTSLPYVSFANNDLVTSVSCGSLHTCALFTNKRMFCWGSGFFGQLGQNTGNDIGGLPGQMTSYGYITFSNADGADKITTGADHT